MNGRALALPSDRAISDVVAYIETLPDTHAKDTIGGDIRKGRDLYNNLCTSCHGQYAEGNSSLKSPPLVGLQSWYQLEQLIKFKSGVRGSNKADIEGGKCVKQLG